MRERALPDLAESGVAGPAVAAGAIDRARRIAKLILR